MWPCAKAECSVLLLGSQERLPRLLACRNKKDLNRNFPDRYSHPKMRPSGKEEPETVAIMNWTLSTGFVASASFHEVGLWLGACP
jgi:hypothetical protein